MRALKLISGLFILFATPAIARDGAAWMITQKSGEVRVLRNGVQPASLQLRAALAPGDVIATGATGRAMLTNGDDYVVVAPASRLVLPKEQAATGFTRLMQQVGTMLYKVRHTGVPHFSVETPLLAAVVKGTSFTIVVDKDRAAVQVTDGVVEVSSAQGAARRLVERGATVYVGRARPDSIVEVKAGEALPSRNGDATGVKIDGSGDVPLSAVTSLTSGLLQPLAPAPVRLTSVTAGSVTPIATAGAVQGTTPATTSVTATPVGISTSTPAASTPSVTAAVSTTIVSIPAPSTTSTPAVPVTAVLSVPAVSTPSVTTAVSVPAVSTATVTAVVATSLPTVTAAVSVPAVNTPTITSTVAVPTVPAPALPTPAVIATVTTPTITTPVVTVSTPVTPTITVPSVPLPSVGLSVGVR